MIETEVYEKDGLIMTCVKCFDYHKIPLQYAIPLKTMDKKEALKKLQEIPELKDIVERHEKFETYVLFENKQLKEENEKLSRDKAILGSFEDDVKASFYMNSIEDLDDLDKVLNNLKQKLQKIHELIPMLIKQLKSGEADNEGMCAEYGGDPKPRATQYKTSIKELEEILENKV